MVTISTYPKWSEDLTIRLIIEYEKREYLWNPVSEHYNNKVIREQSYLEIINALNEDVTIDELKNKIKNLRSSYNVEVKKILAARKIGAQEYKPSVAWFKHLDRFLRAIVAPSSVENMVEISLTPTYICKKENSFEDFKTEGLSSDLPQDLSQNGKHEFEMFGKLIASQLRKLPLSLALDTQMKIKTLINAATIQAVYQQYNTALSPSSTTLSSSNILASTSQSLYTSRSLHNNSLDSDVKLENLLKTEIED